MTEKHSRYQFKELILTAFVASTMVLFAFTSCQTKDEKAVIQFTCLIIIYYKNGAWYKQVETFFNLTKLLKY